MNAFHLFSLGRIPVAATGGYLLIAAYFGYVYSYGSLALGAVAALCITLSLLVHEFGHALVARRLKLGPKVVLHGWGGLTFHGRAETNKHDAFIIAAGPFAGLLLSAAAFAGYSALPHMVPGVLLVRDGQYPSLGYALFALELLYEINLFWSLLNLVPVWPLDGGQLFRLLMLRFMKPAKAERVTHVVGIGLAIVGILVAALLWKSVFSAIIAASLLFENWRRVNSSAASGPIRLRNEALDKLLAEATERLREGDAREALRLAHQGRDMTNVSAAQLDAIWVILTVASAAAREWDDVIHYSLRAPRLGPVFAARVRALVALGRRQEARAELAAADAPELPASERAALEALVAA
ncbi:MAG: hypothetical protein H6745_25350 [Deltaproteobacteria bacterium]|nr:hypothetical protein [Deltaproteobacteria bacterium]